MRFGRQSMRESRFSPFGRFGRSHEFWLLIVILALCASLGLANAQFLTMQNLFDLLTSYAFVGILALGLLVVLIAGGIDISFTATASVAQYVTLSVANAYGANWISVFAFAIGIGGALGALNAIFIQKLRIPSIIVSVATLNIFYGLLIFFTGGKYIYSLPDWFATGVFWFEFEWGKDTSYGVNLQILALAVSFLVTWLLLNRTNIGRQIYAMGGNADAAQRLGFHIFGLNMLVYCYMGVMAGIASLVQAQLAQSVAPTVLVGKDRKSTRLNSSHLVISYAVFCLKKKNNCYQNGFKVSHTANVVVSTSLNEVYPRAYNAWTSGMRNCTAYVHDRHYS